MLTSASRGSHGSLVVKMTDSWLVCHEFKPSAAEDPPCYVGERCTLNLLRAQMSSCCAVNWLHDTKIMPCRESNLGHHTRKAKSSATSVIAHPTQEEPASAKEKNRQRMGYTHAKGTSEQHVARLEDAHLRAQYSCFANHISFVLNKRYTIGCEWLKDVKPEKTHQSQI
ncbi:hypothetical protein TNCV_1236171 [Trichonephila clavipes]|nr:hypothetical protein TNCV_1236171 [Trichonephila clavipes]